MNYEDCLKATIQESVVTALEKMKTLDAEDRYNLLVEFGEWIFCELEDEEVLMVPNFKKEVQE